MELDIVFIVLSSLCIHKITKFVQMPSDLYICRWIDI